MAETPRRRRRLPARRCAPGVVEDTAYVAALDERVTVPAGTFEALLVEQRSELEPRHRETSYAEGLGVVEERVVSGSYRTVRLVERHD